MANKKLTKGSLFASMISLLMCFAMLLGTTFAWFTDSAASGSNVITSGNLDIKVEYTLDGENWNPLDGATDLFQKGLWEPGHTEVVALKITNMGTLALKYAANMNIASETTGKTKDGADIVLSDILTVSTLVQQAVDADGNANAVGDITLGLAFSGESSVAYENVSTFKSGNVLRNNVELLPGAAHYMIVKVDMAETVGNEANHDGENVPAIDFGINILATQFTYENDSFGDQYDKDASTDDVLVKRNITLTENATDAVTVGDKENVTFNLSNYTLNNSLINEGVVTVSNGTINVSAAGLQNYGDATLTNVEMNAGSAVDYSNICYAGSETTYNSVNVISAGGGIGAVDGAKVTFNSGSVAVNSGSTAGRYNFYAVGDGTEITINGGMFSFSKTLNQKRAYIYAGSGATVYVTGGTFGEASTRSGYTAGILGDGKVIITGGTFGFDPTTWIAEGCVAVESNGTWTVSAEN